MSSEGEDRPETQADTRRQTSTARAAVDAFGRPAPSAVHGDATGPQAFDPRRRCVGGGAAESVRSTIARRDGRGHDRTMRERRRPDVHPSTTKTKDAAALGPRMAMQSVPRPAIVALRLRQRSSTSKRTSARQRRGVGRETSAASARTRAGRRPVSQTLALRRSPAARGHNSAPASSARGPPAWRLRSGHAFARSRKPSCHLASSEPALLQRGAGSGKLVSAFTRFVRCPAFDFRAL